MDDRAAAACELPARPPAAGGPRYSNSSFRDPKSDSEKEEPAAGKVPVSEGRRGVGRSSLRKMRREEVCGLGISLFPSA